MSYFQRVLFRIIVLSCGCGVASGIGLLTNGDKDCLPILLGGIIFGLILVVPLKKWVDRDRILQAQSGFVRCSSCQEIFFYTHRKTKRCPNCGMEITWVD